MRFIGKGALCCLVIGIFGVAGVSWAGAVQGEVDGAVCEGDLATKVKAEVDRNAKQMGFSGAVLMARQGKVVLAHAAGMTEDQPLESTTLFEIASCTKSFAGVAAVLLQQQGKLDLDDSIADHLSGVPDQCKSITIRQLINHTSGIPGDTFGPATDDASIYIAAVLRNAPANRPGAKHEYWNQGYALLSEVIASASGVSFADFCKAELFEKAEMRSSCFNGDQAVDGARVAFGRSQRGPGRSALSHPYSDSYDFSYRAMGGMVTNVWDLWRFTRVLNDRSLLNEDSLKELTTIGQADYALGWRISGDVEKGGDDVAWWHSGGVRGFICIMKYFPNTDSFFVILCNDDDGRKLMPIAQFCEMAILDRLPGPIDAERLTKIAGRYHGGGRTFTIPETGENPAAEFGWGGPVTRGPIGVMSDGAIGFYDGDKNYPVEFVFGDDGKATGCNVFDTTMTRRK